MSLLERPFVGAMHAWPSALDARAVLAHKSRLLLQGDFLTASPDDRAARFLGRCLYRGAALWEQWLLEHAPASPDQDERRLVSALSLAERAGDWQLVDALLDQWGRRGLPKHRRFYRTMHARVAQEMPRWQQATQALRRWDDRWRNAPRAAPSEAERVAITAQLQTLDAAHVEAYTQGRMALRAGRAEEAVAWLAGACLADPFAAAAVGHLGVAYAAHDPARAVALCDEAAATLGQDSAFVVLRARFVWLAWVAGGRVGDAPVTQARAALAAVAARRASQGGKGGDLTAALDALATVVLAATLAAAGDHAALVAVLEAATARLPTHDALRAMTKAARELGAAAARLEPQLEAEMVRESQRLLAA